jgi:hypothetical protein
VPLRLEMAENFDEELFFLSGRKFDPKCIEHVLGYFWPLQDAEEEPTIEVSPPGALEVCI